MKSTFLGLASAAIAICGIAPAYASSVNFTLTQAPALSDGAISPPGQTSVGQWTHGVSNAIANTRLGWGYERSSHTRVDPVPNFWSAGFGSTVASSLTGGRALAQAQVLPNSLSAMVDLSLAHLSDSASANVWWQGDFELAPHQSVTLTGIGSFEKDGSSVPVAKVHEYDGCNPSRNESLGWAGHCSQSISAYRTFPSQGYEAAALSFKGGFNNVTAEQAAGMSFETLEWARLNGFSYSTGENGELSMTLTNHLDVVSTGHFYLSAAITSVVPEPETYLCMLLGLGALGGVARWRNKA